MKILVTGSSGHLGEAICRHLHKSGKEYIGIDIKKGRFTKHLGSLSDRAFVRDAMVGIKYILHTATLHKPHIVTHSKQDFIDTNITGTLNLLEEARLNQVEGFIFTSTTSTFGDTLTPDKSQPAVWVTENIQCIPKNIYGVTKTTAEDICKLYYRNHEMPCLILRTSRFFLEEDDNKELRGFYKDPNIKANEYLYRRVDIEDVVSAHMLALDKVCSIGFRKYIISATSPFRQEDLTNLNLDAPKVLNQYYPKFEELYIKNNWKMFPQIGRVYVNERARIELGWKPKFDFQYVLNCLEEDKDFRSKLALEIGVKGYHKDTFTDGPYPVRD